MLIAAAVSAAQLPALPAAADGAGSPDRIEDRVDRRENRRDEAVDNGPLDVIEDHLDRAEDRQDRRENRQGDDGATIIVIPDRD